jgi:chromosome partitioning protein
MLCNVIAVLPVDVRAAAIDATLILATRDCGNSVSSVTTAISTTIHGIPTTMFHVEHGIGLRIGISVLSGPFNPNPEAVSPAPFKRIVAITNQKGGVGKTTTAINLAAALAAADRRVLLVDGDPQGNATSGLGVSVPPRSASLYEVLLGDVQARDVIRKGVHLPKLDVLPATPDLAGAEVELVNEERREVRLSTALASERENYDYILIDCPPSLGLLTVNMLAAADSIIIPLQCEYFALEGLTQLLRTVQMVRDGLKSDLEVGGVLLTMYDSRLNLSRQVAEDAREHFGGLVFKTVIPRNIRLAEAPSYGKPILLYDIGSVGSSSYMAVAKEVMTRMETFDSKIAEKTNDPNSQPK